MTSVIYGIANFFGELIGIIGLLVFGAAAAWLLLSTLRQSEKPWQVQAVIAGMFFVLASVVIWRSAPGDIGAFALGAGIGLLYWRNPRTRKVEDPIPPAPPETPKNLE